MLRIRVATFNVRNGRGLDGWSSWPFRRATTARTIAALDADVIALQEVFAFQQRYLEHRASGCHFVAAGRDDGTRGERCPVVADGRVADVVDVRHRWFGATPDRPGTTLPGARFPRLATTATLELADGRQVAVTSTHLDESSADRRRVSSEQLVATLDADVPQVVMGDLNADPGSDVLAVYLDWGLTLVEPAGTTGTEHRFTGRTDGRRIDHILVSRHFDVVDARVFTARLGRHLASDHFPVCAIIDLR